MALGAPPDGPGASSVAKCYRLLRTILTTAVEDGLIVANPCSIKGAGIEPAKERMLPSLAEVQALADTVRRSSEGSFFSLRSAGCVAASYSH